MKHKIHYTQKLSYPNVAIDVELIPENEQEKTAIKNVEEMEATQEQRDLVKNYLLFGLNIPYSISTVEKQVSTRFILRAIQH